MKPPIRYLGSKARLAPWIIEHFPAHQTYVEPFGGSGAVLLAKSPSPVEIFNDLDGGLVNLFRVIQTQPEKLRDALLATPHSRAEFDFAAEPSNDPLEAARRYMVRNQQSRAGLGEQWQFVVKDTRQGKASSIQDWEDGIARLDAVHQRLRHVQIEQADWRVILNRYDRPDSLWFIDPPYVSNTRVHGEYNHELVDGDHRELVQRLLHLQGMVVLAGYRSPLYEPLERAGWSREDKELLVKIGKRSPRVESLWLSPNLSRSTVLTPQQLGAASTHRMRVKESEATIQRAIRELIRKRRPITKSKVAEITGMSREHLSRRYAHLFKAA